MSCVKLPLIRPWPVKSLMYGFGDDRNPATDAVNVMEEILVEYITDVVSCYAAILPQSAQFPPSVKLLGLPPGKLAYP
jgi:hypothetical protein